MVDRHHITCQWNMRAGQPLSTLESRHFRLTDEETPSFSAREKQSQRNIRNNSTFQCTLRTSLYISKILSKAMSKTPRVDQLSNRTIAHFNVVLVLRRRQAVTFMATSLTLNSQK